MKIPMQKSEGYFWFLFIGISFILVMTENDFSFFDIA